MSEEKTKKTGRISRREFLKDAGLIVGGATIGSMALVNACGGGSTTTVTSPGSTKTVTSTIPGGTVTTTVGAGSTVTVTTTVPGPTVTVPVGEVATDVAALSINGVAQKVQVKPYWPLSYVLRDRLGLFGTKVGCEFGQCASCTVLVDGVPTLSCLSLAIEMQGKDITTVEGLSNGTNLTPLQQKWYDNEAFQCGFCTPGFMMAAEALLANNPTPTVDEVRAAFAGHICTCQNFKKYIENTAGGV
jgi:aerobic-type carbon monoxide dehydrogenase small subunit (CoxS/CutS family)